jgi:predicted regulator of Ras-like GTPase activity (Roadblock/LC7/MglB family)
MVDSGSKIPTSKWNQRSMTKTRTEQMVARLREMQIACPDIEASAVVSVDGLIMASALPAEVEEDRVSAMSAAMLSLGDRISMELGRGALEQVYIRGDGGFVVLSAVGDEAVLTVLAREQAKLGLVFLEMRRAAEDLERVVG